MRDTIKQISDSFDFAKPLGATITSISLLQNTHIILQDLAILLSIAYTIYKLYKLNKQDNEVNN
jgi:hypothetical protein